MDADYLELAKATSGHDEIELFIEHTINKPQIVEQVDATEVIGIMREKCENGDVQRGNNATIVDVEVKLEEVLSTLLDHVDWEQMEVEHIDGLFAIEVGLNTAHDGRPNCQGGDSKVRQVAVDYGTSVEIVKVNIDNEFLLDYDSAKDKPFKRPWVI